eukprot:939996-Pelagomonas_calceolata.AAC.1
MDLDDPNKGYNAATGEFCDLVKAGIIDPLKVGMHALVCMWVWVCACAHACVQAKCQTAWAWIVLNSPVFQQAWGCGVARASITCTHI